MAMLILIAIFNIILLIAFINYKIKKSNKKKNHIKFLIEKEEKDLREFYKSKLTVVRNEVEEIIEQQLKKKVYDTTKNYAKFYARCKRGKKIYYKKIYENESDINIDEYGHGKIFYKQHSK
jgi:predicted membrane-bound dolichyl-phosphate-mannose-protein mannosyltransferase